MLGYIHIIKSKYDIASLGRHFDIIFLCKKVSYLLRHSYYFVQYDTILYCTVRQNTIQCYSVIEWNKIFWKFTILTLLFHDYFSLYEYFLAASFPLSIYYILPSNIKLPFCKSLIGLYQTQLPLRPLGYLYIYRLYI